MCLLPSVLLKPGAALVIFIHSLPRMPSLLARLGLIHSWRSIPQRPGVQFLPPSSPPKLQIHSVGLWSSSFFGCQLKCHLLSERPFLIIRSKVALTPTHSLSYYPLLSSS